MNFVQEQLKIEVPYLCALDPLIEGEIVPESNASVRESRLHSLLQQLG